MKILLIDQQKCYFHLIFEMLKHNFENTIQISMCFNVQELRNYDMQIIDVAIIVNADKNLEMLSMVKAIHCETKIILLENEYLQIHEAIKMGIKEYLIVPNEIDTLCDCIERFFKQKSKLCISLKDSGRKHIFVLEEIKYIETSYNDLMIISNANQCFVTHIKNLYGVKKILQPRFMQVNQSILVNLQCIDCLTDYEVVLQSKEVFRMKYICPSKNMKEGN